MYKASQAWWEDVKNDDKKLSAWLRRQYIGEVTAAERIKKLSDVFCSNDAIRTMLGLISSQEILHAEWVLELLNSRNITVTVKNPEERYWKAALRAVGSFETAAAIAAHAEGMRLERIAVIAGDVSAPEDIRNVFMKILKDEIFHEKAFKFMAGNEALEATLNDHNQGRKLLGLVA